jgi:hypothetical protein
MTRSSDIDQAPPPPSYSDIGCAVRVLDGEPIKRVRELMNTILDQAACAPPSLDWSDPGCWIDARLSGELRTLARMIWWR